MENYNRRTRILINKKFQLSLIIKFLLINTLLVLVFAGLAYLFLDREIEANLFSAHARYRNFHEMLLPVILFITLFNIVISTIMITFVVLYASFRISGPVYRFTVAVGEMAEGNLKPLVKLRNKDQLEKASEALEKLSNRLTGDFNNFDLIAKDLDQFIGENRSTPTEGLETTLEKMRNILKEYQY